MLLDPHVLPSLSGSPIRRCQRHRRSLPHGDGAPLCRSTRHQPSTDAVEPVSADDDVDMPDDGLLAAASLLFGLGDALGDGESAAVTESREGATAVVDSTAAAVPAGEF